MMLPNSTHVNQAAIHGYSANCLFFMPLLRMLPTFAATGNWNNYICLRSTRIAVPCCSAIFDILLIVVKPVRYFLPMEWLAINFALADAGLWLLHNTAANLDAAATLYRSLK